MLSFEFRWERKIKAAVMLHETTNQLIKEGEKGPRHLPVIVVTLTSVAGRDVASGSCNIPPRLSDDSRLLESNQSEIVSRITPSLTVISL